MQYFWKEDDYYGDEARGIRNAIDKVRPQYRIFFLARNVFA